MLLLTPSPAPTVELRKGNKNFTHSLAVYGRGGALLHPRGLAAAQGFSGRAMLAPTMKLQKGDIILRKPCLSLVGACIAGPPTVRGRIFGVVGAARAGGAKPRPYYIIERAGVFLRGACNAALSEFPTSNFTPPSQSKKTPGRAFGYAPNFARPGELALFRPCTRGRVRNRFLNWVMPWF